MVVIHMIFISKCFKFIEINQNYYYYHCFFNDLLLLYYRIPHYRKIMLAIKEGIESVAFDLEHGDGAARKSVIATFNNRRHQKAQRDGDKARVKEVSY